MWSPTSPASPASTAPPTPNLAMNMRHLLDRIPLVTKVQLAILLPTMTVFGVVVFHR